MMSNNSVSLMSRRGFLGLGILAGIVGIAGCGEEGGVKKIDTPPAVEGTGNRSRLDKLQKTADNLPAAKKKKP